ncbi:hypothetical protein D9M71_718780 [compost metagenome]
MAVVVGGQVAVVAAGHDHEDELVFLAGFGHPHDLRTLGGTLVDHAHSAEVRIEADAGFEFRYMKGHMGEGGAHGNLLLDASRIGPATGQSQNFRYAGGLIFGDLPWLTTSTSSS